MATTAETPRGSNGRLTEEELLSALPARSANREVRVGLFVLTGVAAFLIAISKAGNGDTSAPPFNVGPRRDSDRAALLHCLFIPET